MNSVLNLDFLYCYRCKRQPIEQDNSPFVVCVCKHIFCNKCKRCKYIQCRTYSINSQIIAFSSGNQTRDLVYCSVCHKRVKFMPITPQVINYLLMLLYSKSMILMHFRFFLIFKDLPVNVRSSFESTNRLVEHFESSAEFQDNIQSNCTDQLVCIAL